MMYAHFELTLVVTHACNLRCSYCYTGRKSWRTMPLTVAERAVARATASLQRGGTLDVGFFGGEPLLETERIEQIIAMTHRHVAGTGINTQFSLTTNGTVTTPSAWSLMLRPEMTLAVSCDGLPEIHDRHRRFPDGGGSAALVYATIRGLVAADKVFAVAMTVRPDTIGRLVEGVRYLQSAGVRRIEPVLDLWTDWPAPAMEQLERAIAELAPLWRDGLPRFSISWFDETAARLGGLPVLGERRCGFGCGHVAVAPSGRLYTCERLIGADAPDNPNRLPGRIEEEPDFLRFTPAPGRAADPCEGCAIRDYCNTTCRGSNLIRSGHVDRPDRLLCKLNRWCVRETGRVLQEAAST